MRLKTFLLTSAIAFSPAGEAGAAEPVKGIEAANQRAIAFNMGEKAKDGLNNLIGELIQKDEDVKRGPVATLLELMAEYGDDFDSFAVPGTEQGKTNAVPETFYVDLPKEEGGTKRTKMNWFTEFYAGTATGKAQTYELNQLAYASRPETMGKVDDAFKKAFNGYNDPAARKVRAKLVRNRMSKGRGYIRRACETFQVLNRLQEEFADRVVWSFLPADSGQPVIAEDGSMSVDRLAKTPAPIVLEDARNPKAWTQLAASQVLALDIDEAAAAEGGLTYDRLLSTLGRGANKDDGTRKDAIEIKAPETFLNYAYAIGRYINPVTDGGAAARAAILKLARSGKNKDEYIAAIGDLFAFVSPLYAEVEDDYKDYQRTEAKKAAAERKAKQESDGQQTGRKQLVSA